MRTNTYPLLAPGPCVELVHVHVCDFRALMRCLRETETKKYLKLVKNHFIIEVRRFVFKLWWFTEKNNEKMVTRQFGFPGKAADEYMYVSFNRCKASPQSAQTNKQTNKQTN